MHDSNRSHGPPFVADNRRPMNAYRASSRLIDGRSARPSQMQFREWTVLLISFCIIGIISLLAVTRVSETLFFHLVSQSPVGEARPRTAAIVVETDLDHCRQFTFDNDTGEIFGGDIRPCEGEGDPSASNMPKPIGTMRRLDAISRSFLGRQ